MQEKDNVPEDRGPVQDLRELERLDQVHDAGDHTQRDCHVSTHTHMQWQAPTYNMHISIMCYVSRAMMMTACDLSAIAKPWEIQSKVQCDLCTMGPFWFSSYCKMALQPQWHPAVHSNKKHARSRAPREAQRDGNR